MKKEIFVTRSSLPSKKEYIDEISSIWENHWLTNMGEKHNKLESELKNILQVSNLSLFSNGHMALELVIQAMNLHGEVITTPFTFASTTHAIVRNGLTPVFCDIREDTYTIDASKIESLITERTSAIIPVHVYGNICEVEEIEKIAQKYSLKVIYDAAHAFGVTYNGIGAGNFGDASMFSFHATKVFNTIEGGAVCFRKPELGIRLYQLKNFGIENAEKISGIGANAKMNEFQAAMGLCNLKHIKENIEKREKVHLRYMENLENVNGIILPHPQKGVQQNYSYFPVLVDEKRYRKNRDSLYDKLKENGIFARKYFYPLTSSYDCYKSIFPVQQTPVAERVSKQVLTFPMYSELTLSDVDEICKIITEK